MSNQVFFPLSQDAINAGVTVEQVGEKIAQICNNEIIANVFYMIDSIGEMAAQCGNNELLGQCDSLSFRTNYSYENAAWDAGYTNLNGYDSYQELCEANDIEPIDETESVRSYYIVSEYLCEQLEEIGEATDNDFMGHHIWGRVTYGQMISCDYEIHKVAEQRCIELSKILNK